LLKFLQSAQAEIGSVADQNNIYTMQKASDKHYCCCGYVILTKQFIKIKAVLWTTELENISFALNFPENSCIAYGMQSC
jgi:spore coat polysaccharide biosynthesis predicted glycosyltransferase SpsG